MITVDHPLVFAFGLLGNVFSFMVYLAPLPTFMRIYKKKSTEGFESVPYVVAIFSAMLWIYYALLKGNSMLLITISVAGAIIETIYVAIFIIYAPRPSRISTVKLMLVMNFVGYCSIILFCNYVVKAQARLQFYGWICVIFSISVYAAPLSVMRTVIRTKSAEFLPINLSFCLTLTAIVWFFYGFVQRDLYITLPNIVGFLFGVAQMILYGIYKNNDKNAEKQKLPEVSSPVKPLETVEFNLTNSVPIKTENIIPSHEDEQEIEVVIEREDIHDDNSEGIANHNNELYGPLESPSTCKVNVGRIIGGPVGPAPIQLVQCAA